jgi:hypothetical protein
MFIEQGDCPFQLGRPLVLSRSHVARFIFKRHPEIGHLTQLVLGCCTASEA